MSKFKLMSIIIVCGFNVNYAQTNLVMNGGVEDGIFNPQCNVYTETKFNSDCPFWSHHDVSGDNSTWLQMSTLSPCYVATMQSSFANFNQPINQPTCVYVSEYHWPPQGNIFGKDVAILSSGVMIPNSQSSIFSKVL